MNDFFEQDDFEEFLRESLENYESVPSDSLWGKLQHKIPLSPTIGGSLIFSVVAAITVVGVGSLFYFSTSKVPLAEHTDVILEDERFARTEWVASPMQEEKSNIQQKQFEKIVRFNSISDNFQPQEISKELAVRSTETAAKESYVAPKKINNPQEIGVLRKTTELSRVREFANIIRLQEIAELPKITSLRGSTTPQLPVYQRIDMKEFPLTLPKDIKKKGKPSSFSFKSTFATATRKNTKSTLAKPLKRKGDKSTPIVASTATNTRSSLLPYLRTAPTSSQEPSFSGKEAAEDAEIKQKGMWFLELAYSPHIWTSLKSKKEGYRTTRWLEQVHQTADYGIFFTERRKNGWGFEGGFIYGSYRLNHELNQTIEFSYQNSFFRRGELSKNYAINIESPFWKENRLVQIRMTSPELEEGEQIQIRGNYTYKLNSFQIPAGANYQLELNPKLNLILQGGLVWSFMTVPDGSFSNASLGRESLSIIQVEETERRVFESIDSYIGLGLRYNLSDQFSLKVGPRYTATFRNRANHNEQISLNSWQLNFGLNYSLNAE
ncbi:MAG: outer membrane beta-barrel protein [Bacteroidota bacterium]